MNHEKLEIIGEAYVAGDVETLEEMQCYELLDALSYEADGFASMANVTAELFFQNAMRQL